MQTEIADFFISIEAFFSDVSAGGIRNSAVRYEHFQCIKLFHQVPTRKGNLMPNSKQIQPLLPSPSNKGGVGWTVAAAVERGSSSLISPTLPEHRRCVVSTDKQPKYQRPYLSRIKALKRGRRKEDLLLSSAILFIFFFPCTA